MDPHVAPFADGAALTVVRVDGTAYDEGMFGAVGGAAYVDVGGIACANGGSPGIDIAGTTSMEFVKKTVGDVLFRP